MKPRASARTGRRAASATDDEVRAQAVLRLVEDQPYAQRVEDGDQPRIGVRVVRKDDIVTTVCGISSDPTTVAASFAPGSTLIVRFAR